MEVIVVLNGEGSEAPMPEDSRVRRLSVPEPNANRARSVGIDVAVGEYLRFLDDDDVLQPEGARLQCDELHRSGADMSTGAIRFVDRYGIVFGEYRPNDSDLAVELFSQRPSTLVHAHLFRRDFIGVMRWDASRNYLQDVDWLHGLLQRGDINWLRCKHTVGDWNHHRGPRTSTVLGMRRKDAPAREAVAILGTSIDVLERQSRLSDERRRAAAKALWDYAHSGFRYSPRYWVPVARRALALDPQSRPPGVLMRIWPFSRMNPIRAERLAFPARTLATRTWTGISRALATSTQSADPQGLPEERDAS